MSIIAKHRDKLDSLSGKKAIVVGDLIIDYYRILKEKRLSPEGPVIVFEPVESDVRGGGAMNVASNLQTLGLSVDYFSVGGSDIEDFSGFINSLHFNHLIMKSDVRKTTVKERIVTTRQALLRIDHQKLLPIEKFEADNLFVNAQKKMKDSKVLVLSDYDHGVMSSDLVSNLIAAAKSVGLPIIANTKSKDFLKYKEADIVILNHNEARVITHLNTSKDEDVAEFLFDTLGSQMIVITRGSEGILIKDAAGFEVFPVVGSKEEEVIDVTGAGDTVTAAIAACISVGIPARDAIRISNIAADVVIKKRGTSTVAHYELIERA